MLFAVSDHLPGFELRVAACCGCYSRANVLERVRTCHNDAPTTYKPWRSVTFPGSLVNFLH